MEKAVLVSCAKSFRQESQIVKEQQEQLLLSNS
jgi:hypothetical protein